MVQEEQIQEIREDVKLAFNITLAEQHLKVLRAVSGLVEDTLKNQVPPELRDYTAEIEVIE